jgi:F-type H+-transporting ATPase subunit a
MEGPGALTAEHHWKPLSYLGIDSPYAALNAETITATWIVLLVLLGICIFIRFTLSRPDSLVRFAVVSFIRSWRDICIQTLGPVFTYERFALILSLFIFILTCNWISLLPFVEEPTRDLNTTLALGCISFFYKEHQTISSLGFKHYLKEFLHPFAIMFPINLIGHFSKIISISFRLFGNIFGGSIIIQLYTKSLSSSVFLELLGLATGMNMLLIAFFILFEGLIQAFVFTMLSLTYLSIALQSGEE